MCRSGPSCARSSKSRRVFLDANTFVDTLPTAGLLIELQPLLRRELTAEHCAHRDCLPPGRLRSRLKSSNGRSTLQSQQRFKRCFESVASCRSLSMRPSMRFCSGGVSDALPCSQRERRCLVVPSASASSSRVLPDALRSCR